MFASIRLRSTDNVSDDLPGRLTVLLDALAGRPGYLSHEIGRNVDEPDLWCLVVHFDEVGNYRRALSSYDAKLAFGPIQHLIVDEPSAYTAI